MQTDTRIQDALHSFAGDPQRAFHIAEFLGFNPVASPEDQLAGPMHGGLKWFFGQRTDDFGVHQLYRVGNYDASPSRVGLWIAVLSEWGKRSSDRDRPRRRVARALIEHTSDRRALAILVPHEGQRDVHEAELVFPRIAAATDRSSDSASAVSSVRALIDLHKPNRFHRDLLRQIAIPPAATLLDVSQRWQREFSVEKVTTQFYQEYMKVRDRMANALIDQNQSHPAISMLTGEAAKAWSTRQMGRMLFLWFLQSKRWLGEAGGMGSQDYLLDLWRKRKNSPVQEYYAGILVPLFFEAMATGTPGEAVQDLLGYTPYLNGGLFRRNRLEDEIHKGGELSLPDEIFDPDEELSVLNLLSRYRFTTRESTPDDQSVDPDPELLGRVFENLYQGDERHDSGTYYTPREIVHFMCREALDGYLKDTTGISQTDLEWLRRQVIEKEDGRNPLDGSMEGKLVDELENLRVCDPAVGSGAFLLGMMQEIVLLRRGIEQAKSEYIADEENLITQWKRHAIQYSLYGVDINPEAVEICQLRLWLSLVLDVFEPRDDEPLPNLDFRIVAGDSLVDRIADIAFKESWPPPGQLRMSLESQSEISRLETQITRLRQEFDGTHKNPDRLKDLRDRIAASQSRIIKLHLEGELAEAKRNATMNAGVTKRRNAGKQSQARVELIEGLMTELERRDFALVQKPFLWPVAFPDILREGDSNSGFDIVLANPPYVRQEKLSPSDQESFKQTFPEVFSGTADILVFFYARALQILRPGGWLSFITSNKYMRAAYGEGLRGYLPRELSIERVIDFGDLPLFEANGKKVAAYPSVLVGKKDANHAEHALNVADLTYPIRRQLADVDLKVNAETVRWALEDLGGLLLKSDVPDYPQVLFRKDGWILEDPALVRLFERLMNQGMPLGQVVQGKMFRGIVTGLNEAFVIDEDTRNSLILNDPKSEEVIRPWLQGPDMKRWEADYPDSYILHLPWTFDIEQYPAVEQHLKRFKERLEKRPEPARGLYPWYALSRWGAEFHEKFNDVKIVWGNLAVESKFGIDLSGAAIGAPANFIADPPEWLLAILNSTLLNFVYPKLTVSRGGDYQEFKIAYIESAPVIIPSKDIGTWMNEVIKKLTTASRLNSTELASLEQHVDELAFECYGLNREERHLIRHWTELRHNRLGIHER